MARTGAEGLVRPTLIDRLIAPEDGSRRSQPGVGLREIRRAVARDLEWLLNAKTLLGARLADLEEARTSVLNYGVPDFSTASWRSSADAERICAEIEVAVRRFEPRFVPSSVRVSVLPGGDVDDFSLRFRIEATLYVEPIREAVWFDSQVEVITGQIDVEGAA